MRENNKKYMNNNEKEEKNVILINKMYTGSYLDDNDGNNIGHEIINFFKADDGNNYIYITPYGKVKSKYAENTKYILLTGAQKNNKYNIIAKVEVKENGLKIKKCRSSKNIFKEPYKDAHREQALQYKYGNHFLYDIYKNNLNNDNAIYATFQVENIFIPTKNISMKFNNDEAEIRIDNRKIETTIKKNKVFIGESCTRYILEGEEGYSELLENIIMEKEGNEIIWKNITDELKKIDLKDKIIEETKYSFINLIEKEYNEVIYTNMLKYFFNVRYEDGIILNKFLEWIKDNKNIKMNKEIKENIKKYCNLFKEIRKEEIIPKGRIDLCAKSNNGVLVIENKIKSGINGKKKNGFQLKTYRDAYKGTDFIGLVFVPDYNKEKVKNEEGYIDVANEYPIIKYSELYKFFNEKIDFNKLKNESAKYYEDFKNALKIHSFTERQKEIYKFNKAIKETKKIEYITYVIKINNDKIKNKYYVGVTNNFELRNEFLRNNHYKKNSENLDVEKEKYTNKYQYTSVINGEEIVDYLIKIKTYNIEDAFSIEEKLEELIKKEINKKNIKEILNDWINIEDKIKYEIIKE